jgi:hypothetical protein
MAAEITTSSTEFNNQTKLYVDGLLIKEQWGDSAALWLVYSNDWGSGYNKREAIAAEAIKSGGTITGYKIAVKAVYKSSSDSPEQITWDIYQTDAAGKLNNGYSAANGQWIQLSINGVKSIAPYEKDFGSDINGDGVIGINYEKLTLLSTDSTGVRLARDTEQGLYIVTSVDANGKASDAFAVGTSLEYSNINGTDYYYKREAVAVVAEKDSAGAVTGYRLAAKTTNKSGSNPEQITYDILQFDTSGKQDYGMMATGGQKTDKNIYGMKSLMAFEALFDQDFNGDGLKTINEAKLTFLSKDKEGVRLMREEGNNALYYKEGNEIKALPNSGWMEYSNSWGTSSNSREAVAMGAITSGGVTTGYKMAFKYTNHNDGQTDTVTYEIITLDTSGKQTWGSMVNGVWNEATLYNLKSLTPYEELLGEDLNNDGTIGIDPATLTAVTTDKNGSRLKRDSDKALYIVNVVNNVAKAIALPADTRLEYNDNYNGTDYNKREAVAVEAIKSGNTITGYKIAFKNASKWGSNAEQVTYDVLAFDDKGKQVYGSSVNGTWSDPNVYGAKSLTAFEKFFDEDFDDDKFIGINVDKLDAVGTDTYGVRLKRDASKALYIVDESTSPATALDLPNSGWMEYNNNWGTGSNKREALAVEAIKNTAGTITGYKIAFKTTYQYNSDPAQITYDVLAFDTAGKQVYGGAMAMPTGGNSSTDPNVYGAKSLSSFEKFFKQDFNGDGSIGIDLKKLTDIDTDKQGVRLKRDIDKALYIVNETGTDAVDLPNSGWMENNNTYSADSYNKREAVAIEAVKTGGTVTGYKLAIKNTNKWYGSDEQVSYDIQTLDTSGKQVYGSNVNGMWNDPNIYGAKSLTPYEKLFNEDFNKDGYTGINIAKLIAITTDTKGVRSSWEASATNLRI